MLRASLGHDNITANSGWKRADLVVVLVTQLINTQEYCELDRPCYASGLTLKGSSIDSLY